MRAITLGLTVGRPHMTLNQLRTFLAVADTGSVRAAARQLVVTQAAVSASLAALQKSLGVPLLAPDGRGLRLTGAGQAYAGYVRRILGLLDEAGLAATAAADPDRGELRMAAVTTAAEQIVPGLLGGFRSRWPRTGVRLEAGNRDRVRGAARPASGGPGAGRPPRARLGRAGAGRPAAPARRGGRRPALARRRRRARPCCRGWPARPGCSASPARAPGPPPTRCSPSWTSPRRR